MPLAACRLFALTAAFAVIVTAGCASGGREPPTTTKEPETRDPTALTVVAEIALERGDCRTAAETYAAAASRAGAQVAQRASEVALRCQHLPAAWESSLRWRALAPKDRNAAVVHATVALKLHRVPEARAAIRSALQAAGTENEQSVQELIALLLEEADASTVLAATEGAIDIASASPETLAALGELALDSWNSQRAIQLAQQALERDPKSYEAKRILARAHVLRGDATQAIAAAREAMNADPERGTFELAETLAALDRLEEARYELDRLRSTGAKQEEVARRLAVLAWQGGDFEEAERRFQDLIVQGQATDAALLFLADIYARGGAIDAAIAGYRRLNDSPLAITARTRAADLLLDRKDRAEAMKLLDEFASKNPQQAFDINVAKAHLLSEHGEGDFALELLAAALDRHPEHPALEYDRAVLYERAGKVDEAIKTLESLLARRADDPQVQNALGYTLADHNRDLARAERLIRRALETMPDNPAILDSLGWVRFRRGDTREAIAVLERAYTLGRDPEIAAHWGEVLWKSGATQDARKVWTAALARDPDSEPLKATMQRFLAADAP